MTTRDPPRFSITCRSDDEAVIRCLKALADYVERRRPDGRPGGAVAEREPREGSIRLLFTHPDYRASFVKLATDLLGSRWIVCGESDDDSARFQLA
jgi:hypothetical protein